MKRFYKWYYLLSNKTRARFYSARDPTQTRDPIFHRLSSTLLDLYRLFFTFRLHSSPFTSNQLTASSIFCCSAPSVCSEPFLLLWRASNRSYGFYTTKFSITTIDHGNQLSNGESVPNVTNRDAADDHKGIVPESAVASSSAPAVAEDKFHISGIKKSKNHRIVYLKDHNLYVFKDT
ncbi:hypothetical protein LXL04_012330 [Taraxacum kok-saghyz]